MYEVVGPWLLWLRASMAGEPFIDLKDQYLLTLAECQQAGVEWVTATARGRLAERVAGEVRFAEALCVGMRAKDTVVETTNPARPYYAKKGDDVMLVVATYCQPDCDPYDSVGVSLLKRYRDVTQEPK